MNRRKYILSILLSLICTFCLYGQSTTAYSRTGQTGGVDERWDSHSCKYSNYSYGIGWNLPSELEWKRESGDEKHTIFRAIGGPFLVFINAQPVNPNADLWDIYPQYIKLQEKVADLTEKQSGVITYERTNEKVILFGKHAIKTTFKQYFKDDRFDEAVELYAEEYSMIRNGYTIRMSIKVDNDTHYTKECTDYIKKITQGIILTVGK